MDEQKKIAVDFATGEKTNGLGMMIGQYLEQNLDEFEDKVKQASKLNINTSVEVEKGIATTLKFTPDIILIQNGITQDTHLHLKSSYATLADVLSGKINPFKGVLSGDIIFVKIPMAKPFQAFRLFSFLKIPEELIVGGPKRKMPLLKNKKVLLFIAGLGCGFGLAWLFVFFGWL